MVGTSAGAHAVLVATPTRQMAVSKLLLVSREPLDYLFDVLLVLCFFFIILLLGFGIV